MTFSISPPPAPPPPTAATVFNELDQAADEAADAIETVVEQVLDDTADEVTEVDEQGREIRRQARAVLDDAAREEERLLAEIVGSSLSFIQDRQQEARQLGADAKTAVLITVAVVLVVVAVMAAISSGGAGSAAIRAVEALMSLVRRGVKQAGGAGAPGSQGGAPAGQGDEMERILLPLVTNLHKLRMPRDRVQTRLLVLKTILNAMHALTAGSRHASVTAKPLAPWAPSTLARLARCLTRLEARLRIRGLAPPALAASQGLTRMRGSLAETAQLVKPPVVIAARPGPKALPSHPAPRVPR